MPDRQEHSYEMNLNYKVEISEDALMDLRRYVNYLIRAKKNPQAASRLLANYDETIAKLEKLIADEDTLVLVGDHSWGRNLLECEQDLQYICELPGWKILTRGNHDLFWDAKKTAFLNESYAGKLEFLQGNYYTYRDYALVGTKGFCFEGPFWIDRRGRIVNWGEEAEKHAKKIVARELTRLRASFEAAKGDGFGKFIMFLHYPPTNILEKESGFTLMVEEYGAEQVIYAHCHGESRFHDSIQGEYRGRIYHLASGDYLRWKPLKILD